MRPQPLATCISQGKNFPDFKFSFCQLFYFSPAFKCTIFSIYYVVSNMHTCFTK